jgi:heme a synthase
MNATTTTAETFPQASTDWRLQIPEARRRHLRLWLWSVAALTFLILVVGGITRLTQSGLSIVDWQPVMGVVPPLSEAQWQEAFDRYRAFPEYQQLRRGMSLAEFKFIFFWEYIHRVIARAIGLVFLVPFIVFAAKGYLNRPLATRALLLFGLGAAQGLMGWLMVASGLVDRPSVSHYRLAAHLSLAFVIFGFAVWLARELKVGGRALELGASARRLLLRGLAVLGVLLALQIVWGAFVAGLKAGFYYNTFPLMGGRLVPEHLFFLDAAWRNFLENPIAVQWVHRVLGTVLGLAAIGFFVQVQRAGVDRVSRYFNVALLSLILLQYLLGVLTLVLRVPVSLGVSHQGAAMVIFGVWLVWLHHVSRAAPHTAGERRPLSGSAGASGGIPAS